MRTIIRERTYKDEEEKKWKFSVIHFKNKFKEDAASSRILTPCLRYTPLLNIFKKDEATQ